MEATLGKRNNTRDILIVFVAVLAGLFFRRPDAFTNPQLWAEDCPIFFQQVEEKGWMSLITPYAGYMHFVPRLVALLWNSLHISYYYIPLCYNYSTFLITFFIALNIWKTSGYTDIKNRIVYATSFVFLPLASDIFMNITNVNWMVALYLVNFLYTRYTDHTGKNYILHLLVLAVISLTGPCSILVSPIALAILLIERKQMTFKKILPLGIILLCGAFQLYSIKFLDPGFYRGYPGEKEGVHLLRLFTNNISELSFLRYDFAASLGTFKMTILSAFILAILLYNFIANYVTISNSRRYILLYAAIIPFAAFVHAYWPNESKVLALDNARYYFIPYACIMWLMIIALDKKLKLWHIGLYLAFFALQHRYTMLRLPDKHWKEQIAEYYEGKRDVVDFNPDGWHFNMPKRK